MKKRILCFGDSNTYGYDPKGGRYDEDTRWTMRMAAQLGDGYTVIEEGFNGRTCVFDDPIEGGYKSGAAYLPPCLMSHSPLDAVILMLGTNDTKKRFGLSAKTVGEAMLQLVRLVRLYGTDENGDPPKVIMVAPAPITEALRSSRYVESFGEQAIEVSAGVAKEYYRLSRLAKCEFLDAGEWAEASQIDGVHLTREGHAGLAVGMTRKLRQLFE